MQDTSLFARAKRGDLPEALSLEDIARLSSASLDAPNGVHANDNPILLRLWRLVRAGLLVPTRSEQVTVPGRVLASFGGQPVGTPTSVTTRHYVRACDLAAHLADLGAVGPLLASWVADKDTDAAVPRATMGKSTAEAWHVQPIRDFMTAILAAGEIDADRPDFTAGDVVRAMLELKLWERPGGEPLPATDTLRGYVADVAGKFVAFPAGRPSGEQSAQDRQATAIMRLKQRYGTARPENSERRNCGPTLSASNFPKRVAA